MDDDNDSGLHRPSCGFCSGTGFYRTPDRSCVPCRGTGLGPYPIEEEDVTTEESPPPDWRNGDDGIWF